MFCFSCHGHWSHSAGQELSDKLEGGGGGGGGAGVLPINDLWEGSDRKGYLLQAPGILAATGSSSMVTGVTLQDRNYVINLKGVWWGACTPQK